MIKCIIVGGVTATNVANYINKTSGGSILIEDTDIYASFQTDSDKLKNSLIVVDSLIYLMDESMNLKEELTVLYDLMQNRTFFNVGQIFIFSKNTDTLDASCNNFERLMSEIDYDSYQIIRYDNDSDLTFSSIYKNITGIVDEEEEKNVYKKVYLAERGSDSRRGYDPESYKKNIIPKQENSLDKYEKIKESAIKSDTGKYTVDVPELDIKKLDIAIDKIDTFDIDYNRDIIVVTGKPKAGTSIFASTLAISLRSQDKSVNMIDLSKNCGSCRSIIRRSKKRISVNNKRLLTGEDYSNRGLCIFNSVDLPTLDMKTNYLKYILSIPNRTKCNYLVIDCDYDILNEVVQLCGSRLNRVVICTQSIKDEVLLIKDDANKFCSRDVKVYIFLNQSINFDKSFSKVDVTTVKDLIPKSIILKYIDFNNQDIDLSEFMNY